MLKNYTLRKNIYSSALMIWTIIIFVLLLMPSKAFSNAPKFINIPHADKIVHFVLFFIFSFLLWQNLQLRKKRIYKNIYLKILIIASTFGMITEILQGLMYNNARRSFSIADWIFDTLATIVAILCFYYINRNKNKTK